MNNKPLKSSLPSLCFPPKPVGDWVTKESAIGPLLLYVSVMLILLLLPSLLMGCATSSPNFVATQATAPALPRSAKMSEKTIPSECLPSCQAGLTAWRESMQKKQTNGGTSR